MDFSMMKDFEILANSGSAASMNVQQKKPFDGSIADVDSNAMKLMSDDWNLDSIFSLNNDFLSEFNDLTDMKIDSNWTEPYYCMSSPFSTSTDSENDHDMLGLKPITNLANHEQILSPQKSLMSSSSSDSGLSSDNVDFDSSPRFDQFGCDLLEQPLLSTPIIPELADDGPICKIIKTESSNQIAYPVSIECNQVINVQQVQMPQQNNVTGNKRVEMIQVSNINAPEYTPKRKIQFLKKISPHPAATVAEQKVTVANLNKETLNEPAMMTTINNAPIVINKINGNISGIRKVIHVKKGPNQKSIFLPIQLKNGADIRSIKIIKPSALTKSPKILMAASNLLQEYKQNEMKQNSATIYQQTTPEQKYDIDSMSEPSDCESYKFEDMFVQDDDYDEYDDNNESDQGVDTDQTTDYPKLVLSGEEKRLLAKEGISLPAHYPLTKHEERELKRIRRKIRNKISAQDSRKRKKEYVDGLEERVKHCTDENQTLLKRIKMLQNQNQNLMSQMKKMQSLLTKGGNKTVQPATCLMVLLLSMALIAVPNLKLKDNNNDLVGSEILSEENLMQQNRRSLLYDTQEKLSDVLVDEEMNNDFGPFYPQSENNEHDYAEVIGSATLTDKKLGTLIDFDVDDTVWTPKINTSQNVVSSTKESSFTSDQFEMAREIKTEFGGLAALPQAMVITHGKRPKNSSDLPPDNAYQLKLEPVDVPNIIKLNTDMSSKNV